MVNRGRTSVLLGVLLLSPILSRSQSLPPQAHQTVAVVGGKPVYEDELTPLMEDQFQQLQNQQYEIKSRALEKLINQKLLDMAAEKKGTTADKVLAQEVDSKIAEPTDGEVEAYYLGQKDRMSRPFDEMKEQLRQQLKQAMIQQARDAYMKELWHSADVGILLTPPKTELGYDPTRVRGNPNAPVTIIEFSDFQCPFCRQSFPVIQKVLAKYPNQVKLAYRDFPLRDLHPQAQLAAEAARCATEQGKFWEYHDMLFSNPNKLDRPGLLQMAQVLKLDDKRFVSCLDSGKYRGAIDEDVKAGNKAQVEGTPAFFVNGVLMTGFQPESVLESKIDAELARLRAQQQAH
jgi:protein-disulfide isomerase